MKAGGLIAPVRNAAAFTLLELVVVSALMVVLLALAVPVVNTALFQDPVKSSSRKIIGLVQATREKAVREHQSYTIVFDLAGNQFWAEKDSETDQQETLPEKEKVHRLRQTVRLMDVWTRSGGKQDQGQPVLWISRQGYMDAAMLHLVEKDNGQNVMSLLFSPFIAHVEITAAYLELN